MPDVIEGTGLSLTQIAKLIDHSLLQPQLDQDELEQGITDALNYKMAAASVKPCDVQFTSHKLAGSEVLVGTVVGFPHGANTTTVKVFEAVEAIRSGAQELDMVMNIGRFKSGAYQAVEQDIKAVVDEAHERNVSVKVIFEIHYLTDDEIVTACELSESADADFVKTSTGYAASGATLEAVRLMRKTCSDSMKIKAAGGIRTLDQLLAFHQAGADRIATRSSIAILKEAASRV
ncbi:MAG: deoxyribose-phosphate aldolase [Anaerolineales bacterium]|jgi:deoxyribose-phosphate aldolase